MGNTMHLQDVHLHGEGQMQFHDRMLLMVSCDQRRVLHVHVAEGYTCTQSVAVGF